MDRFKIRATASVIVEREGKILVNREYVDLDHHELGLHLSKPGGHLEDGESMITCAVRETLEETGYRVRPTSLVGVYFQRFSDSSSVNVTFAGELESESQLPITEKDIVEALWMPIEELKARRAEWRRGSTIQAYDDYFAGKRHPLDIITWFDHTKTP